MRLMLIVPLRRRCLWVGVGLSPCPSTGVSRVPAHDVGSGPGPASPVRTVSSSPQQLLSSV